VNRAAAITLSFLKIADYLFGKATDFWGALLKGVEISLVLKPTLDELIKEGRVQAREAETKFGKEVYYAWKED
jgi:hypothetical protein